MGLWCVTVRRISVPAGLQYLFLIVRARYSTINHIEDALEVLVGPVLLQDRPDSLVLIKYLKGVLHLEIKAVLHLNVWLS